MEKPIGQSASSLQQPTTDRPAISVCADNNASLASNTGCVNLVDSTRTISPPPPRDTSVRNRNTNNKADLNPNPSGTSSHIIPGVDHVFFEEELEKMEQQQCGDEQIIVLGADDSEFSDRAFKFYVDNVNRPGYVLHVVHHSNYWGNYEPMDGGPSPKHCEELMQKENSKIDKIRDKYAKLMQENNVKGEFVPLTGKDAWHDIVQHQEKTKAIMIVMGTRGKSTMRRTFLGSVSDDVVHHATCPVLVCCHPKLH